MMARVMRYMFAAIVAIVAVGCSNDFWDDRFGEESQAAVRDAKLTLTISTAAEESRAGISYAGTAAAGDKMNNLTMLLVRDNNTIEKRVDISTVASPTGFTNSDQKEATIQLLDVERGDHTIYLIANNPTDLSAYTEGANVETLGLENILLPTLSGITTPLYSEEKGMPMTAVIKTTLKQGVNNVSAEVERVVGRFGVTFYNHVVDEGYDVVIANGQLSSFNASQGYLFNHDYTVPSGNGYRAFFEAPSIAQRVSHSGNLTPVDTYLYETDANATYELSFMVGVFRNLAAEVTPTVTTAVVPDETNHNDIVVGHQYLIYHPGRNLYLCMNGSSLALDEEVPTTNYDNFLWEFSSDTGGKIKNVGTGRWINHSGTYSSTTDSESSATTFTKGDIDTTDKTIYFRSNYVNYNYRYFLATANDTELEMNRRRNNAPNDADAFWTLRKLNTTPTWSDYGTAEIMGTVYHSAPLTYITELGSPAPLEQIKRNDNLQVGVNIFYNPQSGDFNFEVVPWDEVTGDITFD